MFNQQLLYTNLKNEKTRDSPVEIKNKHERRK